MGDLLLRAILTKYEKCEKKKAELHKELIDTHIPNYLGVLIITTRYFNF